MASALGHYVEVPVRLRSLDVPVNIQLNLTANLALEVEGETQSNFDDVGDFHERFDLPVANGEAHPHLLEQDVYEYRLGFLEEELREFSSAHTAGDLPGAFDALLDLAYVVMGTAHMMGLPWQEGWDEVQRANMAKVRAESMEESLEKTGRGHAFDVVKPPGWRPPVIDGVLMRHGWDGY